MARPRQTRISMDEASHKKNFKPINIRDLFMDKNPRAARWIPGFVYRLLSRLLRIDFMNDPILYMHGYKKDVDFARASIQWAAHMQDYTYSLVDNPEGEFPYLSNIS